jgi:Na+-transporting NADH:ubiquinone oxidoreductase subunit NqrB
MSRTGRSHRDPRDAQILVLAMLLAWGMAFLHFDVTPGRVLLLLGVALGTQLVATQLAGLDRFDPKSPLISALSLCLLLRTGSEELAALTAVLAISSKFLLRIDGRHVFNPTAFGLVVAMLLTDRVWVSAAQWGSSAYLAFLFACAGTLVVRRASRSDVTFAFLAAYVSILVGRAAWLGDPLSIPIHQLQSGSVLLFAFFMISDPKTTPSAAAGRIAFAVLVACGAAFVHIGLFRTNGLIWSLVALAPLVPVLNRRFPGSAFSWTSTPTPLPAGARHETNRLDDRGTRDRRAVAA